MQRAICFWVIFICAIATPIAHASIGLVVGEPFGSFGTMLPAGHAGIYLDHLCADGPTHLRYCRSGENGVVISRYHDLKVTQTDWMAVPTTRFFYGVDDPADTPAFVTAEQESDLREQYRRANLAGVVPSRTDKSGNITPPPYGDWAESIGAAFDRRLLLYVVETTPEQDEHILQLLNDRPNIRRYTLGRANCADFATDILNIVVPGQFHRSRFVDLDLSSPKNLARQLDTYGHQHPELNLHAYEIPQIPGTMRRSRPLRGGAETFIKTKRYLATLIVIQPEFILPDWIVYESKGKWTPGGDAERVSPTSFDAQVARTNISITNSTQLSSALGSPASEPSSSAVDLPSALSPSASMLP